MTKPVAALLLAGLPFIGFSACSNSGAGPGVALRDDAGAAAHPVDSGAAGASLDPFTRDCTTARWAGVSAACWSCLCDTCATALDACDGDCMDILACTRTQHTLVDNYGDISCELRASAATCLATATAQAAAQSLITLDTCLITATKNKPEDHQFRACEEECGIGYSGDVCQRFPAADGG